VGPAAVADATVADATVADATVADATVADATVGDGGLGRGAPAEVETPWWEDPHAASTISPASTASSQAVRRIDGLLGREGTKQHK
jgi:hypothetical protein